VELRDTPDVAVPVEEPEVGKAHPELAANHFKREILRAAQDIGRLTEDEAPGVCP
jgi:hypothetical protein